MAVPKRKMGRARTHARRSTNDKISAPARSVCPQCGEVKLPHRVCGNCLLACQASQAWFARGLFGYRQRVSDRVRVWRG